MANRSAWIIVVAFASLFSQARAQPGREARVEYSLRVEKAQAAPGEELEAFLEARVDEGWHLYSMTQPEGGPIPTTVKVEGGGIFSLAGDIQQPPVRQVFDPNFEIDTEYIEGVSEFLIPVKVSEDAPTGEHTLTVSIRYMVCSDTMCLPPQTKRASQAIEVAEAGGAGQSPPGELLGKASREEQEQPDLLAPGELKKIEYTLSYEEDPVRPGGISKVKLHAEVDKGWHLYSMTQPEGGPIPTTIEIPENPAFERAGTIEQPKIREVYDPNFEMDAEYIDGGDFIIPFLTGEDVPEGTHRLPVEIRYMVCSDSMCLPPQTETFETGVPVAANGISLDTSSEGNGPAAAGAPRDGSDGGQDAPAAAGGRQEIPTSFFGYLLFSIAMGGLALLTPCVFPMIPITVSYFTKREAQTRGKTIKEAFVYALGIIFTFTALGFGLTVLLGAGGVNRIAASPLVNTFIAGVFIVFALSLFGVLELKLPESWINRLDKKADTSSYLGIGFMALTFSLTSFTCTVPFVGTVMVAALQGDWLWSLLGVTGFAAAFAAPFFLLAVFPSFLQSLPKSGNWMNSMKIVMGFIELAAALKFISNIDLVYQWELLTRPVFITVWLAIALVTTIYLLGFFRFPHESKTESIGALRVMSAIFFLSISFYLLRGMFGFSLGELDSFLPPRDYGTNQAPVAFAGGLGGGEQPEELAWLRDYDKALAKARQVQKPVFIDFTGYTCTNCRWMEANMFPLPEVQRRFGEMVLVRLYTDGGEEEHEENQRFERQRFGTIALPYYAIMSPQDEILAEFPGLTRDKQEFVDFLEKGLRKHNPAQVARK